MHSVAITSEEPEVGIANWQNLILEALAQGRFQAKPDPQVIKGGLEMVQVALDKLKEGVSATKIVVEM